MICPGSSASMHGLRFQSITEGVRAADTPGAQVRALVRNPDTSPLPPHVEVVRGDLTVPNALDGCLDGIDANERLGQLSQTGCPTFECENFYSASVSIFRKICHQRSESFFANGFPSISLVSDRVKSQDVPAS